MGTFASFRANHIPVEQLTEAWNEGYAGYFVPMQFTVGQLKYHLSVGDIDLDQSLVWTDGGRPVGFSLLGVRAGRGWIGGFGISPSYRGRGLSHELFAEHMSMIQAHGLRQVQLEVLRQNWARRVYEAQGFRVTRRLTLLEGQAPAAPTTPSTATAVAADAAIPRGTHIQDRWMPPWTREADQVARSLTSDDRALIAGDLASPDGVLVYRITNGVARVLYAAAATTEHAADLVAGLIQAAPDCSLRLANEPEGSPIHLAMLGVGCVDALTQNEMLWTAPSSIVA